MPLAVSTLADAPLLLLGLRIRLAEPLDEPDSGVFSAAEFKPDWIVCDDLGSEAADFLAIDEHAKRLAVIHCKAGKHPAVADSVGASHLHEVVSQAVKNLTIVDAAAGTVPERTQKWAKAWRGKTGRVRLAPNGAGAKQFSDRLRELLRTMDAQKEVWLVLGNGISAQALRGAAAAVEPAEFHVVQALYLLQSFRASVLGFGATPMVLTKT